MYHACGTRRSLESVVPYGRLRGYRIDRVYQYNIHVREYEVRMRIGRIMVRLPSGHSGVCECSVTHTHNAFLAIPIGIARSLHEICHEIYHEEGSVRYYY